MGTATHNRRMIALTEAQTWTMIGAFIALMFGMMTIMSTHITRVMRAEIGGLRAEMISRFETVDARFVAVEARFDAVSTRIDGLDRDVQALVKRDFGLDSE